METILKSTRKLKIIVEIAPPKTLDDSVFREAIKMIDRKNVSAISIPDNPMANPCISNLSLAASVKGETKTPFLLHLTCRDRNLIGLQSQLMGMHLLGFHDVLAVTGDPSQMGQLIGASSVYDVTSHQLIPLLKQLNQGRAFNGSSLGKSTNFRVATTINPNLEQDELKNSLRNKMESGANYAITQPVFEMETVEKLLATSPDNLDKMILGLMPFSTYESALSAHQNVPGIHLPPSYLEDLEQVKDDLAKCQEVALTHMKKLVDVILQHFNSIYLVHLPQQMEVTCQLIDYIKAKETVCP
ncbi:MULTISPECIES: methylenetetrahydrofolate reductase [unclassified Streptococcus]|uniref:methylenetetrahydrofolate reductase n=1 Tax=unclassified Streptococcus TaxID=2608887 RepID=UPI00066FEFB3|nr:MULTISPECIES: methylenetetrahydrofolate reductase [unclassified Streptococcus]